MITRSPDHVYKNSSGGVFLSVTQQLCIYGLNDFSMVKAADLEYARQRGTYTHEAINKHVYSDLDINHKSLDGYRDYVKAFVKFQKETGWEVYKTEEIVHDELLRTAGEFDQVGKMRNNNHLSLLDIKATAAVSATVRLQVAAYTDFYNQDPKNKEKVVARGCLQLLPTGRYKLFWYPDCRDTHVFKFICRVNWFALSNGIIPLGARSNDNVYKLCQKIIKGEG